MMNGLHVRPMIVFVNICYGSDTLYQYVGLNLLSAAPIVIFSHGQKPQHTSTITF